MDKKTKAITALILCTVSAFPVAAVWIFAVNVNNSEGALALLAYIGLAYTAQIVSTIVAGIASKTFRMAFYIIMPFTLAFTAGFWFFCKRAHLFVIQRLASGYLYGIHPQDETRTFSVIIGLIILFLTSVATLIIKGILIHRRTEQLDFSFRNLFAVIAVSVPIGVMIYANILCYNLNYQVDAIFIAIISVILMFIAEISAGLLSKGEYLTALIQFVSVIVYLVFYYSFWIGFSEPNFPLFLIVAVVSTLIIFTALAVYVIKRMIQNRKIEKHFEQTNPPE